MANFSDPYLLNKQDIEATAKEAINCSIGINCDFPVDLFAIIEMWGIDVEVVNIPESSELAKIYLTQCPKIVINSAYDLDEIKELTISKAQEHGNLRFSIAHELGHYFLKAHNNEDIRTRMLQNNISHYQNQYTAMTESQANSFAAALLMPEFAMREYLNYSKPIEMAQKISNDFGVSLTAAFLRLAKLSPNIAACIHVDLRNQTIKHVEYSKEWNDIRHEYSPYNVLILNKRTTIPKYSATNKLLNDSESSVNGLKNQMPIERWFDSYNGDLNLYEWPYLFSDRIITFIEIEYPPIYSNF